MRIPRTFSVVSAVPTDEEGRRRHAVLLQATAYTLLAFSLLSPLGGLIGGRTSLPVLLLALGNGAAMLVVLALHRRGRTRLAGILLVCAALFCVTAISYSMGTIHVPGPAGFMLIVIIAGLLFDGPGIAATALYSSLAVLALYLSERAGLLPPPDNTTTITQWATLTLLYSMTGALTYYAQRLTNQALLNSKMEIEVRKNADEELRRSHDELAQSEMRFEALFNQAHDAVLLIDLDGWPTAANRRAEELLGITTDDMRRDPSRDLTRKISPPTHFLALERVIAGEHIPVYETSFTDPAGRLVWIEVSAELVRNRNGTPLHVQTVLRDISERKMAEDALKESERRYRLISENTADVIWILDLQSQKYTFMSPSVEKLRGYTVEEVLAQSMQQSVTPASYQHILTVTPPRLEAFLHGDLSARMNVDEIDQLHRDGRLIHTEATTTILLNASDGFEILGVTHDITARKQVEEALRSANQQLNQRVREVERLQEELRELTLRDPLTGLYNRRYLAETMPRLLLQAARENKPLSVLNLDIDHFKVINDTFGHQVGDRFLHAVAQVVTNCTRGMDIVCRYGGEEFLIILFGASLPSAEKRAEEIRQNCSEIRIPLAEQVAAVTVSLGISAYPTHGGDPEKIIIRSDQALYASKKGGRNRVTIWSDDLPRGAPAAQP